MQSIGVIIFYMVLIHVASFCLYRAIDRKDFGYIRCSFIVLFIYFTIGMIKLIGGMQC